MCIVISPEVDLSTFSIYTNNKLHCEQCTDTFSHSIYSLIFELKKPKMQKKVEFANRIDLDKAAHNELPQLDIHGLPSIH